MVLGLGGLGNSWRASSEVWRLPAFVGESLNGLAVVVWVVVSVLFAAKWVFARQQALAEVRHPVQCCFIGLAGVSTMLVALAIQPYNVALAALVYAFGAAFTFAFALWRTGGLWQGGRDPATTTAVLYLPSVAGSFVTATVASLLGFPDWGKLAFGAGLFSWLAIESVLIHRLYTAPELAPALRPTLAIQLAPPAVGSAAYLSVTTGLPDLFVHAMFGYALLQALLLLRLLPWIAKFPFSAGYWGSTFGITALATAAVRMVGRGDVGALSTLAPVIFVLANIAVTLITVGTAYLLLRGRLIPTAAAPSSK
jgi:tellurite resistance protein